MFADYAPRSAEEPRGSLPDGLTFSPANLDDAPAIARLVAARENKPFEQTLEQVARGLTTDIERKNLVLTARIEAAVVGFGRARFVRLPGESSEEPPDGWYLSGVIVDPEFRRRGIAAELTRLRLEWIAKRAGEAFYFANSLNRVSIDLHHRLGFAEVRRGISFPGAHFSGGGVGVLFWVDLSGNKSNG